MSKCLETVQYKEGIGKCTRQEHTDIFHEFRLDETAPEPEIKMPAPPLSADIDEWKF